MFSSRTTARLAFVFAAFMVTSGSTCADPYATPPTSGSVDDQSRSVERLVRVIEYAQPDAQLGENGWYSLGERVISADMLGRIAYFHCLSTLEDADGPVEIAFQPRSQFARASCPSFTPLNDPNVDYYVPTVPPSGGATCGSELCFVEAASCVATTLMNYADQTSNSTTRAMQSAEVPIDGVPAGDTRRRFSVLQQTSAANARIKEVALLWTQRAGTRALENLRSAALPTSGAYGLTVAQITATGEFPGVCTSSDLNVTVPPIRSGGAVDISRGERMAAILGTSVTDVVEISDSVMQQYEATADAEFSRNTSASNASRRAWVDPDFSRARGAHVLVGGTPAAGLFGIPNGFCPNTPIDESTKSAQSVIHSVAPPYAEVAIGTAGAVVTSGQQIVDRLVLRMNARDPSVQIAATDLLDERGLSAQDYADAAAEIAARVDAFSISTSAKTFDSANDLLDQYAATGSDAVVAPAGYRWYQLLRASTNANSPFSADQRPAGFKTSNNPALMTLFPLVPKHGMQSAAHFLAYARATLNIIPLWNTSGLSTSVLTALQPTKAVLAEEVDGYVTVCQSDSGAYADRFSVYTDAINYQYAVVRGLDLLRCVVDDRDGSSCPTSDADLFLLGALSTPITNTYASRTGFGSTTWLTYPSVSSPTPHFMVRRRTGTTPAGSRPWEVVATWESRPTSASELGCDVVPIAPRLVARATQAVTPSTEHCTEPMTSCAGLPTNQRIPLEDELSDNGDGVENSWRHWLSLASDAAAEADRLGTEVITQGLTIDAAVEEASAEVEAQCGTSLDLDWLDIVDASEASSLLGTACSTEGATDTRTISGRGRIGFICRTSRWELDLLGTIGVRADDGDPDAAKLERCLGGTSNIPFASLGTRPVCVWTDARGEVCAGATALGIPCPFQPSAELASESESTVSTACAADFDRVSYANGPTARATVEARVGPVTLSPVVHHLNVVKDRISTPNSPLDVSTPPCERLRQVRDSSQSFATRFLAAKYVVDHPLMSLEHLRSVAQRVGFVGRPFDHGEVTYDGTRWASTGDATSAATSVSGWPCSTSFFASAPGLSAGASNCPTTPGTWLTGPAESRLGCMRMTTPNRCVSALDNDVDADDEVARTERAHVTQRLARSVLALRVITGAGLDGFEGPRLGFRAFDGTGNDTYDYANYWSWPEGSSPITFRLPPGIPGQPWGANGLVGGLSAHRVQLVDTDGVGDDGRSSYGGRAYCSYGDTPIWTWNPRYIAASTIQADCSTRRVNGAFSDTDPVLDTVLVFGGQDAQLGTDPAGAASELFDGMGTVVNHHAADGGERTTTVAEVLLDSADGSLPSGYLLSSTTQYDLLKRLSSHWGDKVSLASWGVDQSTVFGWDGIARADVVDALELACMMMETDARGVTAGCNPDRVAELSASGLGDLGRLQEYLTCTAGLVEKESETTVFRNVPEDLYYELVETGVGASGRTQQGDRGAAVLRAASSMQAIHQQARSLATLLRDFGNETKRLRLLIENTEINEQLAQVQMTSTTSSSIASCAGSWGSLDFSGGAAACADAAVQIGLAVKSFNLEQQKLTNEQKQQYLNITERFQTITDQIAEISTELRSESDKMQAAFVDMESAQTTARRQLAKALLYSSDAQGRALHANVVTRRRYSTTQARYMKAREHAIRMAYLAKLALEQRLGVRLADLQTNLSLVSAPSRWESTICTTRGIDYAALRDENNVAGGEAEQYIGDYVRDLENVAQSYRLDFPFHEATSTMVVSLRDDLLGVRDACPANTPTYNLLASSNTIEPTATGAWRASGCEPVNVAGPSEPQSLEIRSCYSVESQSSGAAGTANRLSPTNTSELGFARAHHFRFGNPPGSLPNVSSRTSTTRIEQTIAQPSGVYALSWYGRRSTATSMLPSAAVSALASGTLVSQTVSGYPLTVGGVCTDAGVWCRYHTLVQLTSGGSFTIRIAPTGVATGFDEVDLGGLQLERWSPSGGVSLASLRPRAFVPTNLAGMTDAGAPLCEDTDGTAFREGWTYACTRLCRNGLRTDCAETDADEYCYWERGFRIGLRDLESRGPLENAGVAIGNFNYRVERVGVNFVGSGLRECSGSGQLPSQCYASGFLQYTLEHQGPYPVRNYAGASYAAPLYVARIEHAGGLAAERYLTNPLSVSDSSLIEGYMRSELVGRPMTGTFALRVWDNGQVRFDRLEDVQLLIGYRYWTRFN